MGYIQNLTPQLHPYTPKVENIHQFIMKPHVSYVPNKNN